MRTLDPDEGQPEATKGGLRGKVRLTKKKQKKEKEKGGQTRTKDKEAASLSGRRRRMVSVYKRIARERTATRSPTLRTISGGQ